MAGENIRNDELEIPLGMPQH
ncbi:hypothetical protein L195_g049996, partial [Trifolium pratense]